MNILCIGDIVGKPGRQAVAALVPELRKEWNLDLVVANAENAAAGSGLTPKTAEELLQAGCDCLTLGDHVWDQKDLESYLDQSGNVLRPANFPEGTPGKGWGIFKTAGGGRVGVISVMGRVFMRYHLECPFRTLKKIVEEIRAQTPVIVVDMHAEATSEKVALGHFVDGEVSAVVGTHTHIPTADEKILPCGTAYITDLGMTGPYDSVIGQNTADIIKRFLEIRPVKFTVAENDVILCGALLDLDEESGKARSITRVRRPVAAAPAAQKEVKKF